MKLFISALSKLIFGLLIVGLLIFLHAGSLNYKQGWIFISILFGVIFFFVVAQLATAISTTTSVPVKSPLFGVFIASIVYLIVTLYFLFMLESASKDIENFLMELKVRYLNRILSYFGNLCWSVDTSIPQLNTEKLVGEYKNIPFKILETKNDIFLTFKSKKYFKNETLVKSKKRFNFKCSYETARPLWPTALPMFPARTASTTTSRRRTAR